MTGLHWTSAHFTEVIHPNIEGTGYALERHKRGKIFLWEPVPGEQIAA
jgi:hypothetical protein